MSGRDGQGEIVVAAARGDATAATILAALRRRGRASRLVDEATLARAVLEHRPASGAPGRGTQALPGDRLQLPDGGVVGPGTGLLVWRLDTFPLAAVSAGHREYADAEAFAAGLSWLTGLGDKVLNPPDPFGLAGPRVDLLRLAQLCEQAGVATAPFELCTNQAAARPGPTGRAWVWQPPGLPDPTQRWTPHPAGPPLPRPVLRTAAVQPAEPVLVLDARVVGTAAVPGEALVALAAAAGLRCAEVSTGTTADGRPVVTAVSPVPGLRAAGQFPAFVSYLERRADRTIEEAAA
ncbi:MAG: hypothetical protein AAGC63_16000 [Propionicimonas sp.]|nr:hypothetical protein [Propionicimonas sp.]